MSRQSLFELLVKGELPALLVILIYGLLFFAEWDFTAPPVGVAVCALGASVYLVGILTMGRVWSIRVESKVKLVQKGIFKYVRHPLYLGALTVALGLVIMAPSIILLAFFALVGLPLVCARALMEEHLLAGALPGYQEYMKRTGMFLPKVLKRTDIVTKR